MLCLYIDDSGSRDPDRNFDGHAGREDWFALGGLLINEDETSAAEATITAFLHRWPEIKMQPLRSYDIRNRTKSFRWINDISAARKNAFYEDLVETICGLPIHALACVIDRPGYNERYRVKYGERRWMLCKTAFPIVVERAAKFAISRGSKLRVFCERSDKLAEQQLNAYFSQMKFGGLPFDPGTSLKYGPLSAEDLTAALYEFRIKTKSSLLMQIADLVLWPVCKGGYEPKNRGYLTLSDRGKLLETLCDETNGLRGTKYSCFDGAKPAHKTQKPA